MDRKLSNFISAHKEIVGSKHKLRKEEYNYIVKLTSKKLDFPKENGS
jgi:hypothetical protein